MPSGLGLLSLTINIGPDSGMNAFDISDDHLGTVFYQRGANFLSYSGTNSETGDVLNMVVEPNNWALTGANGSTLGTGTFSITPSAAAPTISKTFGVGTIAQGGTTTLSFTLTNPTQNVGALSGVGFTDTLPAGLVVATPTGVAGSCSGTIAAVAGSASVSLAGSTLAVSGTCSFAVNVTAVSTGMQNNKTGAVTSTESGTGGTASASLTVVPPVRITSLQATPSVLWPPNQKMVPVSLSVTTSGGGGPISCMIASVSSSEPVDPDGDWQFTGNPGDLTLSLRAARLGTRVGTGNGRVYKITVQCGDSFSSDTQTTGVLVPHDQGH
jgi:hypothetical protein